MNTFTFAGVNSSEFNAYVFAKDNDSTRGRIYETLQIHGRDGALLIDSEYHPNVTHSYDIIIVDNFETNYKRLRAFLQSNIGYKRLEDTINEDEFYMACFHPDMLTPVTDMRRESGKATLTFDRKPQRYLKTGESVLTFTTAGTITNPTLFESRPLIRIYGSGTVGIGHSFVQVQNVNNYVDIDCDLEDAYEGAINKNNDTILSDNVFPTLASGDNGLTLGTGITKVEITPRWFTL